MRRRHAQRGTAMVELAVTLPMLAMLMIGLIEVGRYTYYAIMAAHAARAAVQYGAQNLITAADTTGMKNAALADGQNLSQWTITPIHSCATNGTTSPCPQSNATSVSPSLVYFVQVTVTGTFKPLMGYPGLPGHGTSGVPITATATMRVNTQ
jgi:Flp pilus assembly protein TadG